MRSTTVAGAWRAAAAGHAPEAERVGNVPAALRRAIWSADVQQSTAAVSAAFWDKMVPAHNASLMQVAHSSLRVVVLFRHQTDRQTAWHEGVTAQRPGAAGRGWRREASARNWWPPVSGIRKRMPAPARKPRRKPGPASQGDAD
eukprot:scaffold42587_cov62-Phaeocystis_antarctica.AAC.1